MVSGIPLCLLVIGLGVASSQLLSSDTEFPDAQISERRTFKHGKPFKALPLGKKHKKFGAFVPHHVFGKTSYAEIPVVHEPPKPFYKVHRYQGIEVKPVSDIPFSTPEPFIESHSVEPHIEEFAPSFSSDHSFSSSSSAVVYPAHDKPIFSSPSPPPFYAPLPSAPPKPVFSFAPAPQPVFAPLPIAPIQPAPVFSSVSLVRPAPIPSIPLPPPQPIFTAIPVKYQAPILPPVAAPNPAPILPPVAAPTPAPVFPPVPIKIQPPSLPLLPAPSPTPVVVKIPSIPAPSPAPVFSGIPAALPTPVPAFSSFPTALPPAQFSIPSPSPSLPTFSAFPSVPVSATPEPEFPYPPSGTPFPSHIKDISLGDIDVNVSPLPTIEPPKFEEVTPAVVEDSHKTIEHGFAAVKPDTGLFQKFKGWKADKANAALSHFSHFKPKPFVLPSFAIPQVPTKVPVELPAPQAPVFPTLQFPTPVHPLPLAPAPVFFPPAQFNPPAKYESFPPNNVETPPLFNSYGVPIPHDSYGPPHDRLSSAASEEEAAVVPAPSDKKENETQQQPSQIRQEFQNFQPQFQSHEHPIYVPEDGSKTVKDDKTIESVQQDGDEYKSQKEIGEDVVTQNYPNHKE